MRDANEEILQGILDPLIDFLCGPAQGEHADALKRLTWLCTTTRDAVYSHTRKLVFKNLEDKFGCWQLGDELQKIQRKFPMLSHVIAKVPSGPLGSLQFPSGPISSPQVLSHSISLERAPATIHTFEVRRNWLWPQVLLNIQTLTVCPSLQVIKLPGHDHLMHINGLNLCSALRELDLGIDEASNICGSLSARVLTDLDSFTGLQVLKLTYPEPLAVFDCNACYRMDTSAHLEIIFHGFHITDISRLQHCPALRQLIFESRPLVDFKIDRIMEPPLLVPLPNEAFNVLTSCTGLQKLVLSDCAHLRALPRLQACTQLEFIEIGDCPNLTNLSPLASCPALRILCLSAVDALPLEEFKTLGACTGLEELTLFDCWQLCMLPNLQACTQLEGITIQMMPLTNITTLACVPTLRSLLIKDCQSLTSKAFGVLEACTGLKTLCVIGCDSLRVFPDLHACTKLENVIVSLCPHLTDKSCLDSCCALSVLTGHACPSVLKQEQSWPPITPSMLRSVTAFMHIGNVAGSMDDTSNDTDDTSSDPDG